MEDSWLLSTPMPLNANMPTLETKETKTQRESYIVIDEMTNTLEHFGKKKQNNKTKTAPTKSTNWKPAWQQFEHYIHQAIPAYTEKEEIRVLKSEAETLKEGNSKLRHDMCEKEIFIKSLTETLNKEKVKQKWQAETRQTQKHQSR